MKNLKNISRARLLALLALCTALLPELTGCVFAGKEADKAGEEKSIVIMTWNLNNFFDDSETGSEYDEFREAAGWSTEKYLGRINTLSSAIGKIDPSPDIIAVQEIESERALEALTKSMGYSWFHFGNNPDAAIGLGIISRFPLKETRVHSTNINGVVTPRPVLETRIEAGGESLVLFVCHWKSKLGGDEATEEGRRASARVILRRVRELAKPEPQLPVVIMGDLNENHDEFYRRNGNKICALLPGDPKCAELTGGEPQTDFIIISGDKPPRADSFNKGALVFYSPWIREIENGSYFYKNEWETIDHFLLSDQLFNNSGWDFYNSRVIDYPPFINSKGFPPPYDPKTGAGLSDHLPLMLFLKMCE